MSENQNRKVVEKTDKERLEDYDKMVGVLVHKDWSVVAEHFKAALEFHQENMERAQSWDEFLQYRTLRDFIKYTVLPLPENVRADRDALAERVENPSIDDDTNPLED